MCKQPNVGCSCTFVGMHVCVCMTVCMYVRVHESTRVYVYKSLQARACVCLYICVDCRGRVVRVRVSYFQKSLVNA